MFTLEPLMEFRRGWAARRAWFTSLAALFLLLLLLCAALLERWAPRDNQRLQAVAALNADTRVLIAGTSHVFASINPALLRPSTMNLAAPVCSYVCMEGVVRGNLQRVPNLAALVIEFDVVPAFYDTLRAYTGDYRALLDLEPEIGAMAITRWQKYELWRDRALEASPLGPLLRFEKLTPDQLLRRLRDGLPSEDDVVSAGFANGNDSALAQDGGAERVARHVRESPGLSALSPNEAALRRLLQLGVEKGWKLALVRLPHHPSYWAALPEPWQQSMAELLGRLQSDFPTLAYWDLGSPSELTDSDFRNGDHVTAQAAERVTALFQQNLRQFFSDTRAAATTP